ncbi:MAG: hypothetical protein LBF89_02135 [Bacteroidales bacterium]|jgi:hypothetical protein|nr:hypothetical protein [Bacteroidales bacterium]
MIKKTENRHVGNVPAAGSPARNRLDIKPSHTAGTLCAMLRGERQTAWDNEEVNRYTEKLSQQHRNLKLSEAEILVITNWLDVNCQFYPAYGGRKNERFRDSPNFRPLFSFEEARNIKH